MRFWVALALASVTAVSSAQSAGNYVRAMLRQGLDSGAVPKPYLPRVLEPRTGIQPPLDREGILPKPLLDEKTYQLVNADEALRDRDRVVLIGNVEFRIQGYQVLCDRAEGDLQTRVFDLSGNVRVVGANSTVEGQSIRVNFRTERFRAMDARAEIAPEWSSGRLLQDVFVQGRETFGDRREFRSIQGSLTTCNYEDPHYEITGREIVVRPGRRAIIRHARIVVLGRTILGVPFLSIPLNRDERYTPEIGQSQDEGYYIKNRFAIPIQGDNIRNALDARLDYFSKLGTGLGGEYEYESRANAGNMRVYGLAGRDQTLEAALNHRQSIGSTRLELTGNFQRQNYVFAPQNTLFDLRGEWTIPQGQNQTRIFGTRSNNDSGGFVNSQQTIGINDSRILGKVNTVLDVDWVTDASRFIGGTGSERQQINVRFRGATEFDRVGAELEYQRAIPVGRTTDFFGTLDRTPVLTFRSDSRRLIGSDWDRKLPFRTELSIGEFSGGESLDRLTRTHFVFDFAKSDIGNRRSKLDLNGRFQQGIYSDNTAQYITTGGANYTYNLGSDTAVVARYYYQMPFGFTPIQIDQVGRSSEFTLDVSVRPLRTLLLGAQTSYDLLSPERDDVPWSFFGTRLEYRPASYLGIRAQSTYDTFNSRWNNIRIDVAYSPGATYVGLGLRYDAVRSVWGSANLFVDALKWGRLRISSALAYNGYLKAFEARHFSFTYDTHDAEFILQVLDNPVGFRPGREISFFIRLKALPFDTPFGIGRRGQPIGTGTGREF